MTERTFELPVSDCGCFVAGEIGPDTFSQFEGVPKYGVIVWYSTQAAAKQACIATTEAHWKYTDGVSEEPTK